MQLARTQHMLVQKAFILCIRASCLLYFVVQNFKYMFRCQLEYVQDFSNIFPIVLELNSRISQRYFHEMQMFQLDFSYLNLSRVFLSQIQKIMLHFIWFKNHIKYLPYFKTKRGQNILQKHSKSIQKDILNNFESSDGKSISNREL